MNKFKVRKSYAVMKRLSPQVELEYCMKSILELVTQDYKNNHFNLSLWFPREIKIKGDVWSTSPVENLSLKNHISHIKYL